MASIRTLSIFVIKCVLFAKNIIINTKKTTASLSIIGCVFVIVVILVYKRYLVFVQRLIMYLAISALLDSVFFLAIDLPPEGSTCEFQAWALTYFQWCVLLWICIITFNLYWNAIRMKSSEQFEWKYHTVAWLIPFFVSLLPFIDNRYGPADLWCWIVNDWKWRFGIWYCPLFISIIAIFVIYLYVFIVVNRKMKTWEGVYNPDVEHNKKMFKEDVKPLLAYPFIYLAIYIFPLINRMQNAISPEPIFALVFLQALTAPMKGFVNAFAFGLNKETTSRFTWRQLKSAVLTRVRSSDSAIREFVPEIHIDLGSDAMPAVWCVPGAEGVEGATDVTGVTNVAMSDVTGVTDVAEGQRREL